MAKRMTKRELMRQVRDLRDSLAVMREAYIREKELRVAVGDELVQVISDLGKVLDVYEGLQHQFNSTQRLNQRVMERNDQLLESYEQHNRRLIEKIDDIRRLEAEAKVLRSVITVLSLMTVSADPQVVLGYFQSAADELGIKDPASRGPMLDAVLTAFQQSYGVRCRLVGNQAKTAPEIKGMKDFLELLASHI